MPVIVTGLITILIGVGGMVAYFWLSNVLLDRVLFPARDARSRRGIAWVAFFFVPVILLLLAFPVPLLMGYLGVGRFSGSDPNVGVVVFGIVLALLLAVACYKFVSWAFPVGEQTIGHNVRRATAIRPWLFVFPAIFALGLYLVVPVFYSAWLSVTSFTSDNLAARGPLANYTAVFSDPEFRIALLNNFLWVLVVPAASTFIGLLAAQLTDRLSWGNIAKSLVFMPMAISFVGASLIWSFVYHPNPEIGILNAIRAVFGAESGITFIDGDVVDSFWLMVVLIWIQTGFAMVILSAALRGVPEDTIEAAIVDGANPFQIFFKIKVPQIMPTILVVWTTITILVLKVYDIVAAMGNQYRNVEILPTQMMKSFDSGNYGFATAISIVIMVLVLPVMIWNIRQSRAEMR